MPQLKPDVIVTGSQPSIAALKRATALPLGILRQTGRGGGETAAIESAGRKLAITALFTDVRIPSDVGA